jgi:hypothetical protein
MLVQLLQSLVTPAQGWTIGFDLVCEVAEWPKEGDSNCNWDQNV